MTTLHRLPNFLGEPTCHSFSFPLIMDCRAYIVHKAGTTNAPKSFPRNVQLWIEARVAKHKFLRGGVVIIDAIPKRFVYLWSCSLQALQVTFTVRREKSCVESYVSERDWS